MFLTNHVTSLVSLDFFTVPTVTGRVLFVLVLLSHHRRRIVHLRITEHPPPPGRPNRSLKPSPMTPLRAGSCGIAMPSMGDRFRRRIAAMGIREVLSAPSSPWQNPYVERLIGSIRRECLDHVIIFNETHLRRTLGGYLTYYHEARTHLSLAKDAPTPRRAQAVTDGDVIAFPEVGGLHHRYERKAA
jgi:putative transposase